MNVRFLAIPVVQVFHRMWTSCRQLICSWYRVDRIRTAAFEGRLFRARHGSRLLIRERLFDVVSRTEHSGTSTCVIVYELASDDGSAILTVTLTEARGHWATVAELSSGKTSERLLDGDIVVPGSST